MAISPLNCVNPVVIEDSSAIFGEDPLAEEPLFQTPASLISPPIEIPGECLFSTPLPWLRPGAGTQRMSSGTENGHLTPTRELRLRDVATPLTYPRSPSSSPEPKVNGRKRKSLIDGDEDYGSPGPMSDGRQRPVKKTAHNMIEKRYRTNLNDKIAALRDSVPSLRVTTKNSRGQEVLQEDLQGLTPAHKLNKATVLSKATEYIAHLERRNKTLTKENSALKARIDAFEILMMARQAPNMKQTPGRRLQTKANW